MLALEQMREVKCGNGCIVVCVANLRMKQVSKTGTVPLASGIRVEGKEKLKRLILHIESLPHKQALAAKKNYDMWKSHSVNHPWIAVLRKQDAAVVSSVGSIGH